MSFELILTLITVVLMAIFLKNLLEVIFDQENHGMSKKRLKTLSYDGSRIGQSEEDGTRDFLNKVSDPIVTYIFPYFRFKNNEQLNKDLDFVGWGKYVRAEQFRALTFIVRALGLAIGIAVWNILWPFAVILGSSMILGPPFFLSMEVKDKQSRMVGEFPEIIRLIQGYLAANQTLTESIEHTLPYIAPNWQPILENFVQNSRTRNEKAALVMMGEEANIQEVKELLSLIGLSMDQGSDMYLAFNNQHEKVRNMQTAALMGQIHNRKNLAILVQYPMLLMIFLAIGLPTFQLVLNI